jgi:hypothetical protein
MSDNIVTCACGQKNRVPFRKDLPPKCGKCGSLLNSRMNKVSSAKLQKYLIWAVVVLSIVLVVLLGVYFNVLGFVVGFLFVSSILAMYGFLFFGSRDGNSQIKYTDNTIHGPRINNSNYKPGNWESSSFLAKKANDFQRNRKRRLDDDAYLWDPTDPLYQFMNDDEMHSHI